MEKLKFAFQVFTAIAALPVIATMEMNHNKKEQRANNVITVEKVVRGGEGYYFNTVKEGKIYIKNISVRSNSN